MPQGTPIPKNILLAAAKNADSLASRAERADRWSERDIYLSIDELSQPGAIDALIDVAEKADKSLRNVLVAIRGALSGEQEKIPSFAAAETMIRAYLMQHATNRWLYRRRADGKLDAFLVTSVNSRERRQNGERYLELSFAQQGSTGGPTLGRTSLDLSPSNLVRKSAAKVLLNAGYTVETPELRAEYEAAIAHYPDLLADGYTEQYIFTGKPLSDAGYYSPATVVNHKVVHANAPGSYDVGTGEGLSHLSDGDVGELFPMPVYPTLKVFNLTVQRDQVVDTRDLIRYEYDPNLRERMVLPADQRELLDILTSDVDMFTGDLIDGKSAGNVILAKGIPGVGKTLTAEVYSEVIKRPLYSIHSGTLGTTAEKIRGNLEEAFARAQQLNLVLLLDEVDVFVLRRGGNITQNAIVAEFLRTLEYFTGLMFMTTNRPDDIDDAILSRAAAIIDYLPPTGDDARKVWETLAKVNDKTLPDSLLDELVAAFPAASPRDIKMLLRLTMRVCEARNEPLTIEAFARCAMFRGMHAQTAH